MYKAGAQTEVFIRPHRTGISSHQSLARSHRQNKVRLCTAQYVLQYLNPYLIALISICSHTRVICGIFRLLVLVLYLSFCICSSLVFFFIIIIFYPSLCFPVIITLFYLGSVCMCFWKSLKCSWEWSVIVFSPIGCHCSMQLGFF